MSVRIRIDDDLHEISDSSVADLYEWLRRMGIFERGDDGSMVPVSASARAAAKLRDSVHSQEPVDYDDEELVSARVAIDHEANETRGGFDSLPADLVELRHALADRRRRP